jgi:hypothetical protein
VVIGANIRRTADKARNAKNGANAERRKCRTAQMPNGANAERREMPNNAKRKEAPRWPVGCHPERSEGSSSSR